MPDPGTIAGRWTFTGGICARSERGTERPYIECICDCGAHRVVKLQSFLSGASKSCGCLGRENRLAAITFHGMHDTKEYHAFESMKARCNLPYHKYYSFYGGRGIKVLYANFLEFISDVGIAPGVGMTIDRKDNSGNYEKGNCRWVSRMVQQNNTRRNRYITYQCRTLTLAQWGRELNIPAANLRAKIIRTSVDEAFRFYLSANAKEQFTISFPDNP